MPTPKTPWIARGDRVLFAVCAAVVAIAALLVLSFDHGRDQSIYHLVAREILAGKMPYKDAFDFKPPGIFLLYSASRAVFGDGMRGIRIVEVACLLADAALLIGIARAWFANVRAGYVAAALASLLHAQLDFWHTAQPETFGGTITLFCLYLLRPRANENEGPRVPLRRAAAIGALLGFAFLLKPPLVGAAAVIGLDWIVGEARKTTGSPLARTIAGVRRALAPILALAAGVVAVTGVVVVWFAARGALHAMHEVLFVFTPYYTKLSWIDRTVAGMTYYGFAELVTSYSAILCVGLLACLGLRAVPGRAAAIVSGVAAIQLVGVVMQAKFFPYHYAATFPVVALLAGAGLDRALVLLGEKLGIVGRLAFLVAIAFLLRGRAQVPSFGNAFPERTALRIETFVLGPRTQEARDRLASVADVDAGQNRAVADYVRTHTPPGSSIFVWGFECAIYDQAERALASRYIYNVPQRAAWSRESTERELISELERARPSAVVVERNDVFPMVTGDDFDSARSLVRFGGLSDLLADRYRIAVSIGDFDVYLRDDEPNAPDITTADVEG